MNNNIPLLTTSSDKPITTGLVQLHRDCNEKRQNKMRKTELRTKERSQKGKHEKQKEGKKHLKKEKRHVACNRRKISLVLYKEKSSAAKSDALTTWNRNQKPSCMCGIKERAKETTHELGLDILNLSRSDDDEANNYWSTCI
ncbi:hypothetical protein L484_019753 [Morus notabilis]|uniref:Uncharacterized protein n=1 Tax=Morus notabilis TaxID=981085 RepID=W9QRI4_9ROSA|nr:hypothetical protein L484_019753 [Morus notabilis]